VVTALAWVATVISAIFSILLLARYIHRRQAAYLLWGLALAFFAIGSGAEAVSGLAEWTEVSAKTFYIFGEGLTAGYLGAGTLSLTSPRAGKIALFLASISSVLIIVLTLQAPVDTSQLPVEGFEAIVRPPILRIPVIFMNVLGSVAVLVPTLSSAWRAARARELWSRTWALILIALGVFIIAGGHSLAGLLQLAPVAAISIVNATGVTIMFIGFMLPSVEA
jgi:hypothetical protein